MPGTISAGLDRWTNSAQSTLSGGMTAGQTTLPITNTLPFPSGSQAFYRVLVDNEVMQISGGQQTSTWTVIRGVEGTAATTHSGGATVTHDVSAFELNSMRQEFNVIAYGAAGDGVADDSTAFQNAVNDAHAQAVGGVVFIPPMAFKVNATLTTYANVVFVTYGATITGTGASSVAPLIRWSFAGGLTIPGALSGTNGLSVSGGLTITSGGLTMSGGGTINGNLTIAPSQASGQVGLTIAPANVASVTAETIAVQESAQTLTITGGYTTQRFKVFKQPTITAGSALTVTNAATLAIEGPPVQGGSAVLTNAWPLWIQSGTSRFDGAVDVNAGLQVRGTGLASGGNAMAVTPPAVGSVTGETVTTHTFGNTLTITSGYATQRFNVVEVPGISAGSALTVTTAATFAIAGAPSVGGSAAITNAYALWVQAGATNLAGTLIVGGAATLSSTLGVTGATTLSSTLGVTGAATFSSTGAFSNVLNLAQWNGSAWAASNGQATVGVYHATPARAEARQIFTNQTRNDANALEGDILVNA